jgi:hypothetical protein
MVKELKLENPADMRELVRGLLADGLEQKKFPIDSGGTFGMFMNIWLRAYDSEKIPEIEKRLKLIEETLGKK